MRSGLNGIPDWLKIAGSVVLVIGFASYVWSNTLRDIGDNRKAIDLLGEAVQSNQVAIQEMQVDLRLIKGVWPKWERAADIIIGSALGTPQ